MIENIILDSDFETLTVEEQKEYLLEIVKKFLINKSAEKGVTYNENPDLENIIRGYNIINFNYNNRKTTNIKLIISLINVMSNIQKERIIIETTNRKEFKNTLYIYENNKLSRIKFYSRTDYMNTLISLINYIETQFLLKKAITRNLYLTK